jgi:hypothetical protein
MRGNVLDVAAEKIWNMTISSLFQKVEAIRRETLNSYAKSAIGQNMIKSSERKKIEFIKNVC